MNTRSHTNEPICGTHTDQAVAEMVVRQAAFCHPARGTALFEDGKIKLFGLNGGVRAYEVHQFSAKFAAVGWRKLSTYRKHSNHA